MEKWKELRREANLQRESKRQRAVTSSALMGLVSRQDEAFRQALLAAWREETVRSRRDREQQEREAAFAAEVRRYREQPPN